jgi:2-dehydro-3-deoxygalactonokinase
MAQDIWIGIEIEGDRAQGWRFDGNRALAGIAGLAADVLRELGDTPALIIKDGPASQNVPAPALPATFPFSALHQDKPKGHLGHTARLRIAGALALHKGWDGVICLPMADVTHWCQISADEVVSFQSALTPRLAQALGASEVADPDALADTMSRPERLSLHLRSAMLKADADAVAGHLVGAELSAMRSYWLGQQVIVIGQNSLYSGALSAQGVPVKTVDGQDAAREGLIALHAAIS